MAPKLRFCANLTLLFTEYPVIDRIHAAADAGFEAVEILFPYDHPENEIAEAIKKRGLDLALINCPPPNLADDKIGYAAQPEMRDRFRRDFQQALSVARTLGAGIIHIMSGEAGGDEALTCFKDNLCWAADFAADQALTIEPINRTDRPGYFLSDFDLALGILEQVNAPNLHLQFDTYHAHVITRDVLGEWQKCKSRVAHVQVGGYPGRHEPRDCDIDFSTFFATLKKDNYCGWISGEYYPIGHTRDGLDWIRKDY